MAAVLSPAAKKCGFKDKGYICYEEDAQESVVLRELLGIPAYLRSEADPVLTLSRQKHLQILFGIGHRKHLPDTRLPIGLKRISLLKTSLMLRQVNTAVSVFLSSGLTAWSSAILN